MNTHQNKLLSLWKEQRNPSPDCLVNKSKRSLDVHEQEALRYGWKHHIPPAKVNDIDIKAKVEKHVSDVNVAATVAAGLDTLGTIPKDMIDTLRHHTQAFINAGKQFCKKKLNKHLHSVLDNLRKDDSIKICKFDKGNGVVILDNTDYYEKLDNIVMDTTKFKEIDTGKTKNHPIINKENTISNFLNSCIKKFVPLKTYLQLKPTCSPPGKIYGLCKVHKQGEPLRPVVSMVGTAEYNLAKYLDGIIKPCIPGTYMLNSTKGL